MLRSLRMLTPLLLAATAVALGYCGGDGTKEGDGDVVAVADAVAAFERKAGGYKFKETPSLVDGGITYQPANRANVKKVNPLNKALGDTSILWQVVIFDGPEPPLDEAAAKAVAVFSTKFEEVESGVFLGESDIAYVAHKNVVITGPTGGDVEDNTLTRWKAVLDDL